MLRSQSQSPFEERETRFSHLAKVFSILEGISVCSRPASISPLKATHRKPTAAAKALQETDLVCSRFSHLRMTDPLLPFEKTANASRILETS